MASGKISAGKSYWGLLFMSEVGLGCFKVPRRSDEIINSDIYTFGNGFTAKRGSPAGSL